MPVTGTPFVSTPSGGGGVPPQLAGAVPTASAEEFARALARELAAGGMAERVTVQSFDWSSLRALKRIVPTVRTVCLTIESNGMNTVRADASGASAWHDGLRRADFGDSLPRLVHAAGCAAWSPFWRNLTAELVTEAHALGLDVIPWTVNEPGDIEQMLDLRVDGLITDYPDRARAVFDRRGVRASRASAKSCCSVGMRSPSTAACCDHDFAYGCDGARRPTS
jgi:glycerophosphoryl diester phosphodiesterase